MRSRSSVPLALSLGLALAGCGSSESSSAPPDAGADASAGDAPAFDAAPTPDANVPDTLPGDATRADAADAGLPLGAPIVASPGTWTWVDFPDSACDDGSATGVGVYPSASGSTNVLVYLVGGGACWDYETCAVLNTSTHGPYGKSQFDAQIPPHTANTILDAANAQNPFKDWNMVFVPYCTGDLHAGDAVTTYTTDAGSATMHHVGRKNVAAYLARLAATFAAPGKVAVAGSSAGGGGAVLDYPRFRAYWPNATTLLVDDSLPLLEGSAIPPAEVSAFYASWNLAPLLDPLCGASCRSDLSLAMKSVAAAYPNDRMALLSSEQDQTIRGFFQLTPQAFQTDLLQLATDVLEPTGHFRHFFVTGQTHTMLGTPGAFSTNGTTLWSWLAQMESGDVTWASVTP